MAVKELEADEPETTELDQTGSAPEAAPTADAPDSPMKPESRETSPRRLRVSISVRALIGIAAVAAVAGAVGTLAWLYIGVRHELQAQVRQSENDSHAEKVALDYAVNAAEMDFKNLNAWKAKLVAGTTPELTAKLTDAAQQMEQIMVPLEWTSTARPLAAKVRSANGGLYAVDCFVSVLTKTVQSPAPLQSTATYSVTIDSNNDWQIRDVGGVDAVVEQK